MSYKKSRNWTESETILLCEILADPTNNYLATLEAKALKKAPTKEVYSAILEDFIQILMSSEFVERNEKHFSDKKPFSDINLDTKRLQIKYNNIKSSWKIISNRQKHGSGLSPEKLPRWYEIINQSLADKNEGLDDIASCPADTYFNENDSESDDIDFLLYEQYEERNTAQPDVEPDNDAMDTIVNTIGKTVWRPKEERGRVRSQTQALTQLAASINKLADINTERLKSEVDDRAALLRFRKEEAEATRRHEIEIAQLYMRQNQNLSLNQYYSDYSNFSNVRNSANTSDFPVVPPWNDPFRYHSPYHAATNFMPQLMDMPCSSPK